MDETPKKKRKYNFSISQKSNIDSTNLSYSMSMQGELPFVNFSAMLYT